MQIVQPYQRPVLNRSEKDKGAYAEIIFHLKKQIDSIRKVAEKGKINQIRTVKVDLFLETYSEEQYFLNMKTVKPNMSNFKAFKRILLEWIGIALTYNPDLIVHSLIAIPYHPYEPEPCERWTI